jgi:hypothetical protein
MGSSAWATRARTIRLAATPLAPRMSSHVPPPSPPSRPQSPPSPRSGTRSGSSANRLPVARRRGRPRGLCGAARSRASHPAGHLADHLDDRHETHRRQPAAPTPANPPPLIFTPDAATADAATANTATPAARACRLRIRPAKNVVDCAIDMVRAAPTAGGATPRPTRDRSAAAPTPNLRSSGR